MKTDVEQQKGTSPLVKNQKISGQADNQAITPPFIDVLSMDLGPLGNDFSDAESK